MKAIEGVCPAVCMKQDIAALLAPTWQTGAGQRYPPSNLKWTYDEDTPTTAFGTFQPNVRHLVKSAAV